MYAYNSDVRLHYLERPCLPPLENPPLPLIYVPGTSGTAKGGLSIFENLKTRKVIAMSLRGRGQSDTPHAGYSLQDHASDIEAVVNAAELNKFYIFGFSVGAVYSIVFSLKNLDKVKGIIIGDYPAFYPKLPAGWAHEFKNTVIQGQSVLQNIREEALEGIERESKQESLWQSLRNIKCPVLVLRGNRKTSFGTLLSKEDLERYTDSLNNVTIATFEDAGHMIYLEKPLLFLEKVESFIKKIDKGASG
jgi:pimeloyl-ACP methyl ester carboxylesterase